MRAGLLVLFFIVSGCIADREPGTVTISGKVIAIADGDTFTLLTGNKRKYKIRMHGIDCPERRQDFGQVARQKLTELIFGKQVRVEQRDIDRYKRTVGLVYDDLNRCINEEMLKAGLAWHYKRHDNNPRWDQLESEARHKRIGIWSQRDPRAPWEWRRKQDLGPAGNRP